MDIINVRALRADTAKYPDVASQIASWCRIVESAAWQHLGGVRDTYPHADRVGRFTVFNIKGNKYRLIVSIKYEVQTVQYRCFLTHAEYDKGNWKKDPDF